MILIGVSEERDGVYYVTDVVLVKSYKVVGGLD